MMRTSGGAGPLYDAVRVERVGNPESWTMRGLRFSGLPRDLAVACRDLMARSETGEAPRTLKLGNDGRIARDGGNRALEFASPVARTHDWKGWEGLGPHFGLMRTGRAATAVFALNLESSGGLFGSWKFGREFAAAASRGKVEWADGEAVEL